MRTPLEKLIPWHAQDPDSDTISSAQPREPRQSATDIMTCS